jgi:hypothetical protein
MSGASEAFGWFLAILGVGLILWSITLALDFPRNAEEALKVAKGWIDGLIFGSIGIVLLGFGVKLLRGSSD